MWDGISLLKVYQTLLNFIFMIRAVSCIFVTCLLLMNIQLPAQSKEPGRGVSIVQGSFEYYIYLSGVNKKSDVIEIQDKISAKNGVNYFLADRFPVRYFKLITAKPLSKEKFENWLNNKQYKIEFFEAGAEKRENAIVFFNKLNKNAKR